MKRKQIYMCDSASLLLIQPPYTKEACKTMTIYLTILQPDLPLNHQLT